MNVADSAQAQVPEHDELPSPCLEINVRWGASVLHTAHLSPPRSFYVGEDGDCFLPPSILGVPRAPLILVEGDEAKLLILQGTKGTVAIAGLPVQAVRAACADGAPFTAFASIEGARLIPFPHGSKADLEIGGVLFQLHATSAARRVKRRLLDRRNLGFYIGSGLLHVGLLAALSCAPTPPEDEVSTEQVTEIQRRLMSAYEEELEELEAESVADSKEGGTGTRAKGEEGSMGQSKTATSSNRYGIKGPSDNQPIARQEALRNANEFGMIGLLNSGAGGDPNAPTAPWGRDDSLGKDPLQARGNMWGAGLSGSGQGGGGIGLGSIGTIGHGAGTGSAQGFGAGAARPMASAPEIAIDPNGRFATTYRPGGGHLAAFETAVARGVVPAAARELVSDIGAHYTPRLEVPADRALALQTEFERGALAPSGGEFHLRVALQSSAQKATERPHLSVHLVLDTSGSMSGEPIAHARDAALALVDKLAPTDDFSLVTFSNSAEVKVADGPVGSRRGFIKGVIAGIDAGGGTNIGDGLALGYAQANLPSVPKDAVRVVLLLSDGRATSGITNRARLSQLSLNAFQAGIQTSSFGLGTDYDGALMSSIASDGAGGYYYLRDPDQIAPALSTEIDQRLDPVATAVEVRVRLKKGIRLLRVYGSRRLSDAEASAVRTMEVAADAQAQARDGIERDRQDDSEGGMRFFMPAFARDDSHALLFKLSAPAGASALDLATVELKYKDRLAKKNVVDEIPIRIAFANSDAASAATINPSVARTVQGFLAGETLTQASALIAAGQRAQASGLLAEREALLRAAASSLDEPLFLRDAARLARLREHAGSDAGLGDPLVLSMLLETAGRSHLR